MELSRVIFHLKPSLRIVAIHGSCKGPKIFFILPLKYFLVSLFLSIQSIVSISGGISPHNFEMFSISPQQTYSFRCWFSNNSVQFFFARVFCKLICGRSWHFLLNSPMAIIYLLFFHSGGIVMLLSSTHLLGLSGPCSFHAYPVNRSVVPFCSSSFRLIKPCTSFQPECCLKSFLPIVPFFQ